MDKRSAAANGGSVQRIRWQKTTETSKSPLNAKTLTRVKPRGKAAAGSVMALHRRLQWVNTTTTIQGCIEPYDLVCRQSMSLFLTKKHRTRLTRLRREDWLEDAVSVLVKHGIESVQITYLARRLGMTRGSFYWHFDNRGALLNES